MVVNGSYIITDNGSTVIVSDGSVTVSFKYTVTITTHPIQKNEFGEYYITPINPIVGVPVKITASELVLNSDSSLTITDPVDTLVIDNVGTIYHNSVPIGIFFGIGDLIHIVWARHAFICNALSVRGMVSKPNDKLFTSYPETIEGSTTANSSR